MKQKIIDEIKQIIDESLQNNSLQDDFSQEEIYLNNFDNNCLKFNQISSNNNLNLVFIDGGNNEIFSTPSFNLSLIKISAIFFNKGIKKSVLIKECLLFSNQNKKVVIENKFNILDKNNFDKSLFEEWLIPKCGFNNRLPEIFRRLNELDLALKLSNIFKENYIVIDGTLNQQFKDNLDEKNILKKISENIIDCDNQNIGNKILGLVKTNREIDINGNSLFFLINEKSPINKSWITNIFETSNNLKNVYAKLNSNSKYIFKIDFFDNLPLKVFENLVHNSNDLIFKGYPYGLILADKFAKVSDKEINFKKTILLTKIDYNKIEIGLNALNIHDKIDSINL